MAEQLSSKCYGLPPPWIGTGVSGSIKVSGDDTVVKTIGDCEPDYDNSQRKTDHDIEVQIYQRLGSHPRICKYLGSTETDITLERHTECVRKRLHDLRRLGGEPTLQTALKWSLQTAEGQAYIHSKGVLQADISGGNLLLNKNNDIVLCDFAGSSIDGSKSTVAHGTRFERPHKNWDLPPTIAEELFALGSMIYEIWTTRQPYEDEDERVVEQNFTEGRFPEVGHLRVGGIIIGCWKGSYEMVSQVVEDLEQLAKCLEDTAIKAQREPRSNIIFYSSLGLLAASILFKLRKPLRQ
ncbi:MAG: hypothetical protein Q9217_001943 [Psora testacea]